MKYESELIVSAALDGERIDVDLLRDALASDEGRKMLASFVLVRAEFASDNISPSRPLRESDLDPAQHQPMVEVSQQASRSSPSGFHWHPWHGVGPRARIGMAASFVMVAVAFAFWLGTFWQGGKGLRSADQLKNTAAAKPFRGADTSASLNHIGETTEVPTTTRDSAGRGDQLQRTLATEPPKPTRVLKFLVGTEWPSEPRESKH